MLYRFSVMGSHPGDGGIVVAKDFMEAFVEFSYMDAKGAGWKKSEVRKCIRTEWKEAKQESENVWVIGDYVIRRLA